MSLMFLPTFSRFSPFCRVANMTIGKSPTSQYSRHTSFQAFVFKRRVRCSLRPVLCKPATAATDENDATQSEAGDDTENADDEAEAEAEAVSLY
jgi:triosephosphate isomerase